MLTVDVNKLSTAMQQDLADGFATPAACAPAAMALHGAILQLSKQHCMPMWQWGSTSSTPSQASGAASSSQDSWSPGTVLSPISLPTKAAAATWSLLNFSGPSGASLETQPLAYLTALDSELHRLMQLISSSCDCLLQKFMQTGRQLPPVGAASAGGACNNSAGYSSLCKADPEQLRQSADQIAQEVLQLDDAVNSCVASLAQVACNYDLAVAQGTAAAAAGGCDSAPAGQLLWLSSLPMRPDGLLQSKVCSHSADQLEGRYTAAVPQDVYHQSIYKLLTTEYAQTQRMLVWGLGVVYARLTHAQAAGTCAAKRSEAWQAPDTFERDVTKHWVQPANMLRLKLAITRHMPLLVYGAGDPVHHGDIASVSGLEAGSRGSTCLTSSVYFDNKTADVYQARVVKEHGARLARVRWYGRRLPGPAGGHQTMYVELKTHLSGAPSTKERAPVAQAELSSLLSGVLPTGLNESRAALLTEVQHFLKELDQSPAVRTEYLRTAWQQYDSNAVRLSLDQDMLLLREQGAPMMSGDWCGALEGQTGDALLSSSDVVCFPYCVFETKLASGQQEPTWLQELRDSGVLIEVDKFSKFIHGMASLLPATAVPPPVWFDDIQSRSCYMPVSIQQMAGSSPAAGEAADSAEFGDYSRHGPSSIANIMTISGSSSSNCENVLPLATCKAASGGLLPTPPPSAHIALNMEACAGGHGAVTMATVQGSGCDDSAIESGVSRTSGGSSSRDGDGSSKIVLFKKKLRSLKMKASKAAAGKSLSLFGLERVSGVSAPAGSGAVGRVQTRIEPKTFFANERTFLQWLNVSVLVMMAGLGLLSGSVMIAPTTGQQGANGSPAADCGSSPACVAARASGATISSVSILFLVYALYLFRKRTQQILTRSSMRYDDQLGPVALTVLLVVVVLLSLCLSLVAFRQ